MTRFALMGLRSSIRPSPGAGFPRRRGAGRLVVRGAETAIELRGDLGASAEPLAGFRRLMDHVRDRMQTAMPQSHVFTMSRLAPVAQALAAQARGTRS